MGAREGVEPVNLVPFSFKEFRGTKNPPHSMRGVRQEHERTSPSIHAGVNF